MTPIAFFVETSLFLQKFHNDIDDQKICFHWKKKTNTNKQHVTKEIEDETTLKHQRNGTRTHWICTNTIKETTKRKKSEPNKFNSKGKCWENIKQTSL
jgi:phenylalanyl-tRNA synthetase alpha subunit